MAEERPGDIAADQLGLYMLSSVVRIFEQLPGYSSLTAAQQQVHLDRLDQTVRRVVAEALNTIFKAEYPACVATLDKVSIAKDIIGSITVVRTAESRHELMDRTGQKCVIVMADPDRYYSQMKEVKARADQRDLFHDPKQPLGHMGVDTPPSNEEGKGEVEPDTHAGGESGLDDAIPQDAKEPAASIDLVTPQGVQAGFDRHGVNVRVDDWSETELADAMIWVFAADEAVKAERDMPALPDWIAQLAAYPPPVADAMPKAPVLLLAIEIPDGAIDAEIVAGLKMRGIKVKAKSVRAWSQSQRVVCVSWLQSETTHAARPDFIPAPDDSGEG
jgi:hypothetical protein